MCLFLCSSTLTGDLSNPPPSQGGTVQELILCFTQILTLGMCYLNHSYILDSFMFKSERRKENILILHKYHVGTQWHGPCWSSLEVKWKSRNWLRTDLSFYLPVQLYDSYLRKKESRDHVVLEISSSMKTLKYTKFKNMAELFCIH